MVSILPVSCTCETHTVSAGGRTVTIENKTPELTDGERAELSREIESNLFRIFVKYSRSDAAEGKS